MENDSLVLFSLLFISLLQEEYADPGDHKGHHACVNGERNINSEQLSAKNRGDQPSSKIETEG